MHRTNVRPLLARSVQSAVELLESRQLFATFNVTSVDPTGPGSLDAAVTTANATPGADTITFDPAVTGFLIDLGASPLVITDDLSIQGLGANNLAVAAGGDDMSHNRVFQISNGAADLTVSIFGLTITGGDHDAGGGGIFNDGENVTVDACVFDSDNTALGNGGAILNTNDGSVTVTSTTFVNNRADGDGGGGGAIYTDSGTVAISFSTFDSNLTNGTSVGGAAIHVAGGSISVANSTFANNAEGNGNGGAIYVAAGASALVRATTFANNSATNDQAGAGGAMFVDGTATLQNVLFGNNAAAGPGGSFDLERGSGGHINSSHSLIQKMPLGTINGTNTANIVDQDPLLGDLTDNGGQTQTLELLPGSPAIDAGAPLGDLTIDQRGANRSVGAAPDIGAFEVGDGSGPVISTPVINSVSPSPVTGSDQVQTLTINGSAFDQNATVTLRNETAGQDFTNFTVTEINVAFVTLDAVFGTDTATWSVTITNPDTGTTGPFEFTVQAPVPKPRVTIGTNQAKAVLLVDPDGTAVTVTMKNGTADVVFGGDNVQLTPGKKGTTVSGSNLSIDGIELGSTTTSRSNLTIKTKGGDGRVSVASITGATPLGKLAAATTDLSGDGIVLTGQGTINTVQLNSVAHNAEVTLPAANAKGVSFKVGEVQGAVVNVTGPVRSFTTNALAGTLLAGSIQTLKVNGDLSAEVRSTGAIRSVTAVTFTSAKILAGLRDDTSFLPDTADDFTTPTASIGSVRLTGKSAGAFGVGSIIAAPTIGRVSLGTLNTANDGVNFGLGGDSIASVTGTAGTEKLKLSKLTESSQSFASGDFRVKVL